MYDPLDEGDSLGESVEQIDLCSVMSKLSAFKMHIGEATRYKLSIASSSVNLNFFVNEDWWIKFSELLEEAAEMVEDNFAVTEEKSRAAQEERERKALAGLPRLLDDSKFVRLPSQLAMIAYARDRIPELATISEYVLRREIQNIDAQIKAKGIGRRR